MEDGHFEASLLQVDLGRCNAELDLDFVVHQITSILSLCVGPGFCFWHTGKAAYRGHALHWKKIVEEFLFVGIRCSALPDKSTV